MVGSAATVKPAGRSAPTSAGGGTRRRRARRGRGPRSWACGSSCLSAVVRVAASARAVGRSRPGAPVTAVSERREGASATGHRRRLRRSRSAQARTLSPVAGRRRRVPRMAVTTARSAKVSSGRLQPSGQHPRCRAGRSRSVMRGDVVGLRLREGRRPDRSAGEQPQRSGHAGPRPGRCRVASARQRRTRAPARPRASPRRPPRRRTGPGPRPPSRRAARRAGTATP